MVRFKTSGGFRVGVTRVTTPPKHNIINTFVVLAMWFALAKVNLSTSVVFKIYIEFITQ